MLPTVSVPVGTVRCWRQANPKQQGEGEQNQPRKGHPYSTVKYQCTNIQLFNILGSLMRYVQILTAQDTSHRHGIRSHQEGQNHCFFAFSTSTLPMTRNDLIFEFQRKSEERPFWMVLLNKAFPVGQYRLVLPLTANDGKVQ